MRRRRTQAQIRRDSCSYHEAGHAFMAWYCGRRIHSASVVPDVKGADKAGVNGCVRYDDYSWDSANDELPAWRDAKDSILINLAGISAQVKFEPRRVSHAIAAVSGGRSDFDLAVRILTRYATGAELKDRRFRGRALDKLWHEVDVIIALPKNWAIIQRIAQLLQHADTVSGDALLEQIPTHLEYVQLDNQTDLDGMLLQLRRLRQDRRRTNAPRSSVK